MFATLLPGLRELRGPLTVGYAWALALYFVVHAWLPESSAKTKKQFEVLYDLQDLVGRAGVGVAASLIAYLFGGATISYVVERVDHQLRDGGGAINRFDLRIGSGRTDRLVNDLFERVLANGRLDTLVQALRQHSERSDSGLLVRDENFTVDELRANLRVDVSAEAASSTVLDRLLLRDKELYQESDRHQAEAELRLGLLPPGVVLVLGVWLAFAMPWVLKLVVTIVLAALLLIIHVEGSRRLGRARELVRSAIAEGVITTPTIDLLQRIAA